MDTLAYLYLATAYETSANPEPGTTSYYGLFNQAPDRTKCLSRTSIPLLLCAITLTSLSLASPSLALERGNKGSQVTSLQKKLQAAGYFSGPVTGYYGSLTQAAVKNFQQANGLNPNGIADLETLNVLESGSDADASTQEASFQKMDADDSQDLTSSSGVLKRGNRSSQVTSLQKKLQTAGYFSGPITGYYGSLTQAAVKKFQQAKDLTPDGIADSETFNVLESSLETPESSQDAAPQKGVTNRRRVEDRDNLDNPQKTPSVPQSKTQQVAPTPQNKPQQLSPTPQTNSQKTPSVPQSKTQKTTPTPQTNSKPGLSVPQSKTQKITPAPQSKPQQPSLNPQSNFNPTPSVPQNKAPKITPTPHTKPQKTASSSQSNMRLKKKISGEISPKSVVYSGRDLFFAQNMMYSHTITVYDRNYNLVKTISDSVNLPEYGYSKFKGNYKGAPVEASFSHNGHYAWISNYQMYGRGFNNPGSDGCSPSQKIDKSFLYRINTENLNIEKVIQVGSVPKFVAASPDNRLVLASNWCSWDLSIVDTEKNQEIKRVKLGQYPRGIVIDADSKKAYVALMGSEDIAKVDLNNFSVEWLRNIGYSPRHLNIDPTGKFLYATLNGEGTVVKIDLSTSKVVKKAVTGSAPRSMVISDDGQRLYVVNYESDTISKVRTSDMKVLQSVNVNAAPIGITYDPQTREVWVACYSGSILVFQD